MSSNFAFQVRQRIETDPEGKVARMNCYYINYRMLVNVVKYKLDLMHKKMETSERDATSRSNFKCTSCSKTFTDLEADQLLDMVTMEFKCTYCSGAVEEDESGGPQNDSRQMMARFNTQMEKLVSLDATLFIIIAFYWIVLFSKRSTSTQYDLLRLVENVRLAPLLLEPEPVEAGLPGQRGDGLGRGGPGAANRSGLAPPGGVEGRWSGDATRAQGFRAENQQVRPNCIAGC